MTVSDQARKIRNLITLLFTESELTNQRSFVQSLTRCTSDEAREAQAGLLRVFAHAHLRHGLAYRLGTPGGPYLKNCQCHIMLDLERRRLESPDPWDITFTKQDIERATGYDRKTIEPALRRLEDERLIILDPTLPRTQHVRVRFPPRRKG